MSALSASSCVRNATALRTVSSGPTTGAAEEERTVGRVLRSCVGGQEARESRWLSRRRRRPLASARTARSMLMETDVNPRRA
nr:hypothetical protein KRP22_8129 [Phytophthora ramorum]